MGEQKGGSAHIMGKVRLKFPSSFAGMLNTQGSDLVVLEREIGEETTIDSLFADLAVSYTDFRKAVFNPDIGKVSDQVIIILNDSTLQLPDMAKAKLNDGDSIIILPVYSGG